MFHAIKLNCVCCTFLITLDTSANFISLLFLILCTENYDNKQCNKIIKWNANNLTFWMDMSRLYKGKQHFHQLSTVFFLFHFVLFTWEKAELHLNIRIIKWKNNRSKKKFLFPKKRNFYIAKIFSFFLSFFPTEVFPKTW